MNDTAAGCVPVQSELVMFLNSFDLRVSDLDKKVGVLGETISKLKPITENPVEKGDKVLQQTGLMYDLSNVLSRFTYLVNRIEFLNDQLSKII